MTSSLDSSLQNLMATIRATMARELRSTAASVARDLCLRTFPSDSAIGLAASAMRADINSVYITHARAIKILESHAGPNASHAFAHALRRGDLSAARNILRSSPSPISQIRLGDPLDPSLREKTRNRKTGRVETKNPLQIVTRDELAAFTRAALQEIGKTASGWAAAASALGNESGIPKWKSPARHGSAGSARTTETPTSITITIANHRPLARHHISPGQIASILATARGKLISSLSNS